MAAPARRPAITASVSEFEASRLAPCTPVLAASPTAYRPAMLVWPSMSSCAGVLRDQEGLTTLVRALDGAAGARVESAGNVRDKDLDLQTVEATNLHAVSAMIAAAALRRAESRGCHRRADAPGTAAEPWHTLVRWDGRRLLAAEEAL